jgi:hypothetical protein
VGLVGKSVGLAHTFSGQRRKIVQFAGQAGKAGGHRVAALGRSARAALCLGLGLLGSGGGGRSCPKYSVLKKLWQAAKKKAPQAVLWIASLIEKGLLSGTFLSISMPTLPAAISRKAVTPGLFLLSILGGMALTQHAGAVRRRQHQLKTVGDLLQAVFNGNTGHGILRKGLGIIQR